MVRLGLIVMVLVLTGCSALGDAFSGDPQVAGTAAGQTLTVDRLANMVGRAQRIPVRPDVLTGEANVYLDYAVFATELGRGRDLHESALVLATQWPVAAQLKWEHYHAQLIDDARQAHARRGGFSVPGRHGAPVPAHPHPNPAERRADGGAAEAEGSHGGRELAA